MLKFLYRISNYLWDLLHYRAFLFLILFQCIFVHLVNTIESDTIKLCVYTGILFVNAIYTNKVLMFCFWQAYESLSDGLGKSASALVGTPLKKYQRGAGALSALTPAVRAVLAAAIAPASASATAVHYTLLGFRNRLVILLKLFYLFQHCIIVLV